jgi:hypothetical protein
MVRCVSVGEQESGFHGSLLRVVDVEDGRTTGLIRRLLGEWDFLLYRAPGEMCQASDEGKNVRWETPCDAANVRAAAAQCRVGGFWTTEIH